MREPRLHSAFHSYSSKGWSIRGLGATEIIMGFPWVFAEKNHLDVTSFLKVLIEILYDDDVSLQGSFHVINDKLKKRRTFMI